MMGDRTVVDCAAKRATSLSSNKLPVEVATVFNSLKCLKKNLRHTREDKGRGYVSWTYIKSTLAILLFDLENVSKPFKPHFLICGVEINFNKAVSGKGPSVAGLTDRRHSARIYKEEYATWQCYALP